MPILFQIKTLWMNELRLDFREKSRFFSVLFFCLSIFVLLSFTSDPFLNRSSSLVSPIAVIHGVLTLFLGTQIFLMRAFEREKEDGIFSYLKAACSSHFAWYLSKMLYAWFHLVLLALPLSFLVWLGFEKTDEVFAVYFFAASVLCSFGLSALGIFLSSLVLSAKSRDLIYPILFFPLAIPLLLATVQSVLCLIDPSGASFEEGLRWLTLLGAAGVIFFILGSLLFVELIA